MGSDRARITYDESRQYRAVVMQQGRVTLEADWNEEWQMVNEELRKDVLDIVGPCCTPNDGYRVLETEHVPDPFFDFSVSNGTMYVGGMRVFLANPLRYSQQPDWVDHLHDPDWVDPSTLGETKNRREFIYLYLREQEVSAVEDSVLREVALGGPDTAQRLRLIQHIVRVSTDKRDCAGALAEAKKRWAVKGLNFDEQTMRLMSSGTLQASFQDVIPNPDPCEPQAHGGYLGADNQLIRVQISGFDKASNTYRLIWGFDNASFLYRVTVGDDLKTLKLQSRPVDDFHKPRADQAVEVLRSAAQLSSITNDYIASPTGIVATLDADYISDTQSITLPTALPAEYRDTSKVPVVFLRVWEEEKAFTPGTPVVLGTTGVQVTLQTTGKDPLHVGDYWLMAVRPNTGVDPNASTQIFPHRYLEGPQPPDGPRLWACALAVIEWTTPNNTLLVLEDCRNQCGNMGQQCECCTVTVAPGDSLSAAFDKISGLGGTVCLLPGLYELSETVLVSAKKGLTVLGAGAATIISASSIAVALHFVDCVNLTLRDLTIKSTQPIIELHAPVHAEALARAVHPKPASGFGPIDGVVTFTHCQAVRVTNCIVACVEFSDEVHTCISFLSSGQGVVGKLLPHEQHQIQSDPSRGDTPADLQASGHSSTTKDGEKTAGRKGRQTQASRPTTGAESSASGPEDAVSALTSLSAVISTRESLDFTLRDCRLYADTGQYGLFVILGVGVSVEDNWFFPLADLDPAGLETIRQDVAQNQRASVALTLANSQFMTLTNNLVFGFDSVLSASGGVLLLRDNVAGECGDGLTIASSEFLRVSESLRVSDNVLETNTGPAMSISSRGEVFLSGNDLVRLPAPSDFAQNPPQVVSVTADTATLSNNNFRNQEKSLKSSVTVTANRITYTSNRSVCDNLPGIADVILLGPTDANGLTTGSITAVGNTCLEPTPPKVTEFEKSLREVLRKNQADLVSHFMAQGPGQLQHFLQQLNSLDSQGQVLAQNLKEPVSSQSVSASLLASATFTTTGMNLLSNILVRLGVGSDQGSVEGVSFPSSSNE